MADVTETKTEITLKGSANLQHRIEILNLLYKKAEGKANHSDTFRQRNMNYALVIFAGFIALGIRVDSFATQLIFSATPSFLMLIFCAWDRRWHRTKHGWDGSSKMFHSRICEITNDPKKDVIFPLYVAKYEKDAEWFSFQPMVFYFLIIASFVFLFRFQFNIA